MKVPETEFMSDILKQLTGESALPVYSSIQKFRRDKDGLYYISEHFSETVKKRELVKAKERLRNNGSETDFLQNAITYSQTEGLSNDLWRLDDFLNMSDEPMEDGFTPELETDDGEMSRLVLQHCVMPAYQFVIQVAPDPTSVMLNLPIHVEK